jgi:hypothetical protein
MLNESFMRAVVAEKARQRDELAGVHRLRLGAPAPARRRLRLAARLPRLSWPWRSWRRATERRDIAAMSERRPALRCLGDDVFAP